jgi:hypothetical protein
VNGDPSVFPKYENEVDEHADASERPVARNMAREDLLYAAVYRTQVGGTIGVSFFVCLIDCSFVRSIFCLFVSLIACS